jgi:hypothetical protein
MVAVINSLDRAMCKICGVRITEDHARDHGLIVKRSEVLEDIKTTRMATRPCMDLVAKYAELAGRLKNLV